jgi:hypothetical protein
MVFELLEVNESEENEEKMREMGRVGMKGWSCETVSWSVRDKPVFFEKSREQSCPSKHEKLSPIN